MLANQQQPKVRSFRFINGSAFLLFEIVSIVNICNWKPLSTLDTSGYFVNLNDAHTNIHIYDKTIDEKFSERILGHLENPEIDEVSYNKGK